MWLIYLYVIINLPLSILRLLEITKDYKRIFKILKNKILNYIDF